MKKETTITKSMMVIAWVLALGTMAPMLDTTMVNIAVNRLAADFHTTLSLVQWTITGFTLMMGIAVPVSGWLLNRFAGRDVYIGAEVVFGLTSMLAGLSPNINVLIGLRLLQGASAGLILPLMTTLLIEAVGSDKIGRIMAIVGVPMTLGPMVGPILGGIIVQYLSWRWIFFVNVPVALLAVWALSYFVPRGQAKSRQAHFDGLGTVLLGLISTSLIYGIVQASSHRNLTNPQTLEFVALGLIFAAGYCWHAHRKADQAVLPLALFRQRNFTGAMIGLFLAGFITSGPMLLLPLFFQDVRGDSVVIAAVALIPQSVGMLVARGSIGKLIDRFGARWLVIGGVFVTIAGTWPFVYFTATTAYYWLAIVMIIRGIGGAAVVQALMADPFVGLARDQIAAASIGTRMIQQIGNGFGVAVLATVVTAYTSTHQISQASQLVGAYQNGFLWCTVLVLATLLPAGLLTHKATH